MNVKMQGVYILVVEDDPFLSEMYRSKLELDGCRIKTASSAAEAIWRIQDEIPHGIILDIYLEGEGDGFDVLDYLEDLDEKLSPYVAVITNYDDPGMEDMVMEYTRTKYFSKTQSTPSQITGALFRQISKSLEK